MKLHIPLSELENYGCRENIPLGCDLCGRVFYKPKNLVCRAIKGTRSIRFCSRQCSANSTKTRPDTLCCLECGKDFLWKKGNKKTTYCSRECAGKARLPTEEQKQQFLKIRKDHTEYPYPHTKVKQFKCKMCSDSFFAKRHSRRTCCSDDCRSQFCSDRCKKTKGMCKNNNRHSGWYESSIAGRVWLESSWEVLIATLLDEAKIEWSRPTYGWPWIDKEGKSHRYYPDFYLPEYNVYLDPKHPYAQIKDAYKISDVINRHNIVVFVLSKDQLSLEHILGLALSREVA